MIIQSNQTIFDLATQLEGTLDNLVVDVMLNFNLYNLQTDYNGTFIDEKYRAANTNSLFFYNSGLQVETFDHQLFLEFTSFTTGAFDDGFDDGFDV